MARAGGGHAKPVARRTLPHVVTCGAPRGALAVGFIVVRGPADGSAFSTTMNPP